MGDFVFNYFMGAVFEGLVVGIFAADANGSTENSLFVVDWLGFLYSCKEMGAFRNNSTERSFDSI